MHISVDIPTYSQSKGFEYAWENNFIISVESSESIITIKANKAGLLSLARQLLTLAQDGIPVGTHIHYDKHCCLEEDSAEIVIALIE